VDGEATALHVRGVGELDEQGLRTVLQKYGAIDSVTVRKRWDQEAATNTSWALVSVKSASTALEIVEASPIQVGGGAPDLTAAPYDESQSAQSQGAMKMVHRLLAKATPGGQEASLADVVEELNRRMDSLSGPVAGMKLAIKQIERTGVIDKAVIDEMNAVRQINPARRISHHRMQLRRLTPSACVAVLCAVCCVCAAVA